MGEKDDGLGLSLSLGCARNEPSLKLNLDPSPSPHPSMQQFHHLHLQKGSWNELFQTSGMFLYMRYFCVIFSFYIEILVYFIQNLDFLNFIESACKIHLFQLIIKW